MAWLTTTEFASRWINWQRFSPYTTIATSANTWLSTLLTDAENDLHDFIPPEHTTAADAATTPGSLKVACYLLARAKVFDQHFTEKTAEQEEWIGKLEGKAEKKVEQWVKRQVQGASRGGIRMERSFRRDAFHDADQDEDHGDTEID